MRASRASKVRAKAACAAAGSGSSTPGARAATSTTPGITEDASQLITSFCAANVLNRRPATFCSFSSTLVLADKHGNLSINS